MEKLPDSALPTYSELQSSYSTNPLSQAGAEQRTRQSSNTPIQYTNPQQMQPTHLQYPPQNMQYPTQNAQYPPQNMQTNQPQPIQYQMNQASMLSDRNIEEQVILATDPGGGFIPLDDFEIHPEKLHEHLGVLAKFESIMKYFQTESELKRFLINAESRYVLYLRLLNSDIELGPILPPWDVAIVMHSHMLNSLMFRTNLSYVFPKLHESHFSFPLTQLYRLSQNDPELLQLEKDSTKNWNLFYPDTPYSSQNLGDPTSTALYECPYCDKVIKTDLDTLENLVTDKSKYKTNCKECHVEQNAGSISAKRFLNDCKEIIDEPISQVSDTKDLRELLLTEADGVITLTSFGQFVHDIKKDPKIYVDWKLIFIEHLKNCQKLRSLGKLRRLNPQILKRLIKSYRGFIHPFLIQLPEAVLRQRSFNGKILSVNMDCFHSLQNARMRYHQWFALLKSPRSGSGGKVMLVPTLDIDLVWHTHQLNPQRYSDWCNDTVKRFIDHDDNVPKGKLDKQLQKTSLLWYDTYKEPYMVCNSNQIEGFWKAGRVIKGMIFPPYLFYAFDKKKRLQSSFWKVRDEEDPKNNVKGNKDGHQKINGHRDNIAREISRNGNDQYRATSTWNYSSYPDYY